MLCKEILSVLLVAITASALKNYKPIDDVLKQRIEAYHFTLLEKMGQLFPQFDFTEDVWTQTTYTEYKDNENDDFLKIVKMTFGSSGTFEVVFYYNISGCQINCLSFRSATKVFDTSSWQGLSLTLKEVYEDRIKESLQTEMKYQGLDFTSNSFVFRVIKIYPQYQKKQLLITCKEKEYIVTGLINEYLIFTMSSVESILPNEGGFTHQVKMNSLPLHHDMVDLNSIVASKISFHMLKKFDKTHAAQLLDYLTFENMSIHVIVENKNYVYTRYKHSLETSDEKVFPKYYDVKVELESSDNFTVLKLLEVVEGARFVSFV